MGFHSCGYQGLSWRLLYSRLGYIESLRHSGAGMEWGGRTAQTQGTGWQVLSREILANSEPSGSHMGELTTYSLAGSVCPKKSRMCVGGRDQIGSHRHIENSSHELVF